MSKPSGTAKTTAPPLELPEYMFFDFLVHRSLTGFAAERLRAYMAPDQRVQRLEGQRVVIRLPRNPTERQRALRELRLAGRVQKECIWPRARRK